MKNEDIDSVNSPAEAGKAHRKILELQSLLKDRPEDLNGSRLQFKNISLDFLVGKLFAKAPEDFIEKKSSLELKEVFKNCASVLHTYLQDENKVSVKAFALSKSKCSIVAVLGDRPFIVNTISECIRSLGFKIDFLLHPVILFDDYRTSLVYAEIDNLNKEQVKNLIRTIENSLLDLLLITEDYTSMLVQAEKLANNLEEIQDEKTFSRNERIEVADFLRWLTDGGLVFLGYNTFKPDKENINLTESDNPLGIFKTANFYKTLLLREVNSDCKFTLNNQLLIYLSKLQTESSIHRRIRINHIVIVESLADEKVFAIHSILGIFTSKAIAQESSSIPLIRRKLQKLIELEELAYNSHDYKYLVDIIDRMPKDLALRLDLQGLREMTRAISGLQNRQETKVHLRFDTSKRGATVLIVMPRERFNSSVRGKIQRHIEQEFSVPAGTSEYHLDLGNKPLARFYFYIPIENFNLLKYDVAKLEKNINLLSRTWEENLEEQILISGRFDRPGYIWNKYANAFPEEYQATQSAEDAVEDIISIEKLNNERSLIINFHNKQAGNNEIDCFSLYNIGGKISISKSFPILENINLEVISESTFAVTPFAASPLYIQRFFVIPKNQHKIAAAITDNILTSGLESIFQGQSENDWLNALLISAQLNIKTISVLRAYLSLMWQISSHATRRSIYEALAEAPAAAKIFWEMFDIRFNPEHKLTLQERMEQFDNLHDSYIDELREVKEINRDRTLRGLVDLLKHTLRTNFYQNKTFTVLKIQSELVDIMPLPRPKYEIFVFSTAFEGVHFRAADIARGGIRWSERNDDFRNEILGLVKTQKIKNAVIVPNGAKGGFVLRNLPQQPELLYSAIEGCYKDYIRALLSVTDNIVEGKIATPERVIAYDGPDTYLVVAADKGTATFSNLANKIALEEFGFWLGDAFASGGSNGYDHKKFGITAKGAWESVKRHFKDLGINYLQQSVTTVAIGDMSGDVFGNGMIYSKNIKLLAAFNHKHIFIDPTPDTRSSYMERLRLFELAGSSWNDYNRELISIGGGVFGRYDKEIILSPQARSALSIPDSSAQKLSGEEIITHILQAPVDLLWNGGIGTYIKASSETNAEVNDGTNDRVRVNGSQIRARVIAEGGNLGLTQKARIECAEKGVQLNTDAIDNSAGVDLSDHEVNIKILCSDLIKQNLLSMESRNQILQEVADEVVELVLQQNKRHALLLSLGIRRSFKSIEYYISLSRVLHNLGYINRYLETVPDEEEFADRVLKKRGLSSPELAVMLAGVKMWIKDELLESKLCGDPELTRYLLDYFPAYFKNNFAENIKEHALSQNIIASQITNNLIDMVGITFVHRMCITHTTKPIVVIKCLLAAELILKTHRIRDAIRVLDTFDKNNIYMSLLQTLGKVLRDAGSWLISYHGDSLDLSEIVALYEEPYQILSEKGAELFSGIRQGQYIEKLELYKDVYGIDPVTARKLALAPNIIAALEMLWAAKKSHSDVLLVADIFTQIYDSLKLEIILANRETIEALTKWEHQLLLNAFEEIRRSVSLICCKLIALNVTEMDAIREKLLASPSYTELINTLDELTTSSMTVAALSVVARQLRTFSVS